MLAARGRDMRRGQAKALPDSATELYVMHVTHLPVGMTRDREGVEDRSRSHLYL